MTQYTEYDFAKILVEYPVEVTKEQFYRLCHVSKRVATYYLEQGFLPCERRDTKTHKYLIKTADILAFLKKRQSDPSLFQVPAGTSRKPCEVGTAKKPIRKEAPIDLAAWHLFLSEALSAHPDVCNISEITQICGYSKETILKWCEAKKFMFFNIRRTYHIPKKSFIGFMASSEFTAIAQKQPKHLDLLKAFGEWNGTL
jgi:hypothetical protein